MVKNVDYVSTINIDLGARFSGVYFNTYEYGELPSQGKGVTLCLPQEGGKMTWSQSSRTATRHRTRSNKRRKQSKRLLILLLSELVRTHSIEMSELEWERLLEASRGLLNRRGYNRIEAEVDLTYLEHVEAGLLSEKIGQFNSVDNLLEQWNALSQQPDAVRGLLESELMQYNKNDLKKVLKDVAKEDRTSLAEAISLIKSAAQSIVEQIDYGHQHRRDYLCDIKLEIHNDSRFSVLTSHVGTEALWHLVGNISNLQLRTTRWFFNDEKHKKGDHLDTHSLKHVLTRWVTFWRPSTPEEKARQRSVISKLKDENNALKLLTALDPNLTIPPYEDQDNRRPPKDQTLLLSPLSLSQIYGDKWEKWALILRKTNNEWYEGLDEITSFYDRKSQLPKTINGERVVSSVSREQLKLAYFLQRLCDRSSRLDPYALRYISKSPNSHKAHSFYHQLEVDLGEQHVRDFLHFTSHYYNEVEQAKQGLWINNESTILERSDLNPPHKNKLLHLLVGGILGETLSPESLQAFVEQLWSSRVKGNSTVKGLCRKIEDVRKSHGNLFNEKLKRLRYQIEQLGKDETSVLQTIDDKSIWNAHMSSFTVKKAIASYFNHDESKSKRYSSTFSLAQIYNLLESDPRGFSANGVAINLEQNWRMGEIVHDGNVFARCSRMPADSIRPFDGVLKRVLEQQAHAIANKKLGELTSLQFAPHSVIDVHINIEENRFAFTEGLLDLKKASAAKRKQFSEKLAKQSQKWMSKTERIVNASRGICPYTGTSIGQHGEIDHIVPRASSRAKSGTVFNSEANLIWCTRDGNQRKQASVYTLKDLHSTYLVSLFKSASVSEVQVYIEKTVNELPNDFIFESLTSKQQDAVRHALFLSPDSEARQKVTLRLTAQKTSRVNGTQAWFARRIIEQLQSKLQQWIKVNDLSIRYHTTRVSAEEVSRIRAQLGVDFPETKKSERQGVASHTLDAVCVFARAGVEPKIMDRLAIGEVFTEDASALRKLIPSTIEIETLERRPRYHKTNIASQPIFKEGIYGEHFLSIWKHHNEIKVGFDPYHNPIVVEGKSPDLLIDCLSPVLQKTTGTQIEENLFKYDINKAQAFALLDRVWRVPCSEDESMLANLLESLRYTTSKKNVEAALLNVQGNAFKNQSEIVRDKQFCIKVNFTNAKAFKVKGELTYPAKYDWIKLLKNAEIAPLLGTKPKSLPQLRPILERHFYAGSDRAHNKTRRLYSLPIIDAPSGGFRIKRQNGDGTSIYQLHAIEGTPAKGFTVTKGKINWDQLAPIEQLRQSDNVTPVGGRFVSSTDDVVLFDRWLVIQLPDEMSKLVQEVQICPATKSRMYLRVTQPLSIFKQWVNNASEYELSGIYDVGDQLKIEPKAFFENHNLKLLAQPRGTLFIEQLDGSYVSYRYEVGSNNAIMKQAYQDAFDRLSG